MQTLVSRESYTEIDKKFWKRGENWEWVPVLDQINEMRKAYDPELALEKKEACGFTVTPSKESGEPEDRYILIGRGFADKK